MDKSCIGIANWNRKNNSGTGITDKNQEHKPGTKIKDANKVKKQGTTKANKADNPRIANVDEVDNLGTSTADVERERKTQVQ